MNRRRWKWLLAGIVLALGVWYVDMTGGFPRYSGSVVDMPGGVSLPVEGGAIYRSDWGTDSNWGWVYDLESKRRYHFDALMMAFNRVRWYSEMRPEVLVTRDTSAGGVPFEYVIEEEGGYLGGGPELVVAFESQADRSDDGEVWQFVNFILPLSNEDEAESALRFLRKAEWTPRSRCRYCAASDPSFKARRANPPLQADEGRQRSRLVQSTALLSLRSTIVPSALRG